MAGPAFLELAGAGALPAPVAVDRPDLAAPSWPPRTADAPGFAGSYADRMGFGVVLGHALPP
jgi:hypothetical protein